MLSLAFLTLATTIITGNAAVDTTVTTNVSGSNAQVKTEITTSVNGQTNKIESSEPGTLRVTVKDGQTTVSSAPSEATPTAIRLEEITNRSLWSFFARLWERLRLILWR